MHFIPINFSDPGFNPDYTADFQLIIILDSESFSYAVCHPATNRLIRVTTGCLYENLFTTQNQEKFSASKYQKVIIAANSESFCLIPDAVFMPENLADFSAFLSVKEADLILTDQISTGQNTVIFTLPKDLVYRIEEKYPATKIQFAPKSWIKSIVDAKLKDPNLYLFLTEKKLKIVSFDQENIRFYNQFECSTADEVVYFTALVAEQLNLKPNETSLIICGEAETENEPMLLLQQFFKQVSFFSGLISKQHSLLKQHQIVQFLGLN